MPPMVHSVGGIFVLNAVRPLRPVNRFVLRDNPFYNLAGLVGHMLKEVMLGSGGIMLAAAIFASSVVPGTSPAPVAPVTQPPVVVAPPPAPQVVSTQSAQVFPDDSGDIDFGAPMIESAPVETGSVETGSGEAVAIAAAPGSAEEAGGRQFNARPGRSYPTPR